MRSRFVVIAGAGIGGLTAALTLAAQGCECLVLEKSAELAAVGAGVQLSPNASRILTDLGLHDALASVATRPEAVVLNSVRAGRRVARLPLSQIADALYWVIHRADLQAALRAAAGQHPGITIRLDAEVDDFETHADEVRVMLRGETIAASALIGADGVGSRIRQRLFPGCAPVPSGRTAWRGLTDVAGQAEVHLWMGAGAHLVAYPVAGGAQTNLVITLPDATQSSQECTGQDIAAELREAGWPASVCDLVASAQRLTRYPLLTTPPLPAWHTGRVALLGDAAHAMLPFAAQGAAMAIEDAAVLAHCLQDGFEDIPSALARYVTLRAPRVAGVVRAAEQSGRIYHLSGPAAFARDIAIRMLGERRLLKRQDWIYDWRV